MRNSLRPHGCVRQPLRGCAWLDRGDTLAVVAAPFDRLADPGHFLATREWDDAGAAKRRSHHDQLRVRCDDVPQGHRVAATSSNDRMPRFGMAAEESMPLLTPEQIGLVVDWL